MSKPRRIQRSRKKGSALPEGTVYVGRPTIWGNPFTDRGMNHARSVIIHRQWLAGRLGALTLERMGFSTGEIEALARLRERILIKMHELEGKDLACWCPLTSEWCHADTYLHLAPEFAELERLAA